MKPDTGALPPGRYTVMRIEVGRGETIAMRWPFVVLRVFPDMQPAGWTLEVLMWVGSLEDEVDEYGG